jgi:hypothetical protein
MDRQQRAGEARRQIEKQLAAQLGAVADLIDLCHGLFEDWPGRDADPDGVDAFVLALLSRSVNTFDALSGVVRQGYSGQAGMLARSMFEDMVDAHWVTVEPQLAREQYEDHLVHGQMLWIDQMRKYPEQYGHVELPEFNPRERDRLDEKFRRWGTTPWSGLAIHTRVDAIAHLWTDEASRSTLFFYRDIIQRDHNQTLHVSGESLNRAVELLQDGTPSFRIGPRDDGLDAVLTAGFWTLTQTLTLVRDHFGLTFTGEEERIIDPPIAFRRLPGELLQDVGRNDRCPCGSGRKFKRCHGA